MLHATQARLIFHRSLPGQVALSNALKTLRNSPEIGPLRCAAYRINKQLVRVLVCELVRVLAARALSYVRVQFCWLFAFARRFVNLILYLFRIPYASSIASIGSSSTRGGRSVLRAVDRRIAIVASELPVFLR